MVLYPSDIIVSVSYTHLIVPQLSSDPKLFIITSSMILFSIIGVEWLYKGLEQYRYITVRTIIFRLIALAATFLLVKEKSDYLVFAAITAFATVGSGFVNFINLRKVILLKFIGHYEFKRHLKPMLDVYKRQQQVKTKLQRNSTA